MTDDAGYGVAGTFWRRHPDACPGSRSRTRACATRSSISTALCSPTRAALITGRNHHSVGFGVISEQATGYPGYDSIIGINNATIGEILKQNGLRHVLVRQEPQHPGYPIQRASGPSDQWPRGWASSISTASWAAKPISGSHICSSNTTQIFPWVGKPAYNLTTDMADEAIDYIRRLNAAAPTSRFSSITCRAVRTRRTSRRQEWIDKFKGKFDMAGTRCANRSSPTRSGSVSFRRTPNSRRGRMTYRRWEAKLANGTPDEQEAVRAPGRGLCRLRGLYRPRNRAE